MLSHLAFFSRVDCVVELFAAFRLHILSEVRVCLVYSGSFLSDLFSGMPPLLPFLSRQYSAPVRACPVPTASASNKPSEAPSYSASLSPPKQSKPSGLSRVLRFFTPSHKQSSPPHST